MGAKFSKSNEQCGLRDSTDTKDSLNSSEGFSVSGLTKNLLKIHRMRRPDADFLKERSWAEFLDVSRLF